MAGCSHTVSSILPFVAHMCDNYMNAAVDKEPQSSKEEKYIMEWIWWVYGTIDMYKFLSDIVHVTLFFCLIVLALDNVELHLSITLQDDPRD